MTPAEPTPPSTPPDRPSGPGIVSSGWLAASSSFDHQDQGFFKRTLRASAVSLGLHGVMLLVVLLILAAKPVSDALLDAPKEDIKVVYLEQPGPGGGGGGSPAPAAAKPLEIPRHTPPPAAPIVIPTVTPPPVVEPPKPMLNAPIETSAASVMQAAGTSSVSLAAFGGGGRGGGLGSGTGSGVGEGTGGGFGGGSFAPGNGISNPTLIRQVDPQYTSEAMRAKIQGEVHVEAVVLPNGTVGDTRVVKSLDRQFGLDQAAMEGAKKWLFSPGKDRDGKAVPVRVTIILEFRLR